MTTDRDGCTTIPRATWSRLLAPDSGLITQSDALRAALATLDGYTITIELRALHHGAPEQDRRVLEGLALFLGHIAARRRGNHQVAETAAAEAMASDMRRADLYDMRRLGALVMGIARGGLPSNLHTEATDLVLERLGAAEADRLTALIRRNRRTPWDIVRIWLRRRGRARRDRNPGRSDTGWETPT
ncbi:hypothetical protein [Saccharothrix deserti]|uniref:hypothetical protein n=1 Tax=Saccharothrix deserti TaxID=2593674 RepID=UPI00131E80B4|nr:hypothetical protein [Saccharothrix deserti]